jgi:hypothetical protein
LKKTLNLGTKSILSKPIVLGFVLIAIFSIASYLKITEINYVR